MRAPKGHGITAVCRKIKENKFLLLFIFVYAFILTMANEFFFASDRMQNYDQAIYQYIGHLITEGKMPYVDAFDHKGPLLYLIYAVSCLISLKWGAWLINFLVMAGTIGVSYCIARPFVGKGWSASICLILYSGFMLLDFRGGTPEFFAGLFMAISLYYLLDYYFTGKISRKHLLLLGVCGGCIFWLKHSTMITLLLLCIFIIIKYLIDRRAREAFGCVGWYSLGFAVVSAAVCGWIVLNGAAKEMLKDYFLANFLYAGNTTFFYRAQSFLYLLSHPGNVIILVMLTAYILLRISKGQGKTATDTDRRGILFHMTSVWILSLLFLAIPGRNYYHYISALFPLTVLIAAYLLKQLLLAELPNRCMIGVIGLTAVICVFVWPNLNQIFSLSVNAWTEDLTKTELTNRINQYASEEGKISVVGGSAGLYLASGHESATDYPYIASAVLNDPDRGKDFRKQIRDNKPEILIAEPSQDEYELLGYEILKNYYLMDTINSQKLYVRKDRVAFSSSAMELETVIDLETYLSILAGMENCTIMVAVKDNQGSRLNEEIISQMEALGFSGLDILLDKENHTFAGIVQDGKVVFQQIGKQNEAIRYDGVIEGDSIHLDSKAYQYGNQASVQIAGIEYAVNKRGLNFVIYNHKTYEVIDAAAFDTHDKNWICYR